jgi:hypothetical protein
LIIERGENESRQSFEERLQGQKDAIALQLKGLEGVQSLAAIDLTKKLEADAGAIG